MFRKLATTTAIALSLLAAPAVMAAQQKVKEVDVSVDLAAVNNAQAAQYWANIETDLENAIAARVSDRISEDGVKVSVKVSEVELANTFQNITNLADTKLAARVNVTSDNGADNVRSYDLEVTVGQAAVFFPEGTDLSALTLDTPVYYQAMINAFANAVVERL